MEKHNIVGSRVMNRNTRAIGRVEYVSKDVVGVNFHGSVVNYAYPSAFANVLEIENEELQDKVQEYGMKAAFENFKRDYRVAINKEIDYLKVTGGKKYKIIDGELLTSKNEEYLYAFDTDSEFHFPDGTAIKLWFTEKIVTAYVVSCEDYSIIFRTNEYLGESIESVDFTSEQWQLLEGLMDRLDEMDANNDSIAYEIACNGKKNITAMQTIKTSQDKAFNRATSERITFIWGPPGTGKTETLANVAIDHIKNNRRVLMLSYSNVSVDQALLRVVDKSDFDKGRVIRYGYPRATELLESKTLTSYQYVLQKNPAKVKEYQELISEKKKYKRRDIKRLEVNKKLNKLREYFLDEEREFVSKADFVATTVSKATVDKAIYTQKFDVVIFDEASMAYVPQIVFAAGLAKDYFVCLGDFCQLPAIVQNDIDDKLTRDIFEYTGITAAVEDNIGHEWLVMLTNQHRMHPEIADFVSQYMYHDKLSTDEKIIEACNEMAMCPPCPNTAMSLIDLSGLYSVCIRTKDGSRINILSALMCIRLTERIIDQYEVGIITPYSAQSRLIMSIIRDIREYDERWFRVSCTTVHQFQGSEKPVIIYDAVDCYRMTYPGTLLTSLKNDTANRLFNVAITRSKGKFILLANLDYMERKNISKKLIFTKAINYIRKENQSIKGSEVLNEIKIQENEKGIVYVDDREKSWSKFINDIKKAKSSIYIDLPDVINDDTDKIKELENALNKKEKRGLMINIRLPEDINIPTRLQKYVQTYDYVTNPVTIIDGKKVWFGQPLYAADFISEGDILETEYFPCIRFIGNYTARSLQAFLEIKSRGEKH